MTSLPQAPDAEKGLLSAMLIAPGKVISEFIETGSEKLFHHFAHMVIYRQLVKMWQEKLPIDAITVTHALEEAGALESVGGAVYVTELSIFVPAASGWQRYRDILQKKLVARESILIAEQILEAAQNPAKEGDLQGIVQEGLVKVTSFFDTRTKTHSMPALMSQVLDDLEEQAMGKGKIHGILTGLPSIDRTMMGMQPGDMIVLAAHRKGGKSALALQIAGHNALQGIPVAIFSFEMTAKQIAKRLLISDSLISMADVMQGLGDGQLQRLSESVSKLSRVPLYIRDEAVMNPLQLRAAARKMQAEHKCKLMIIDYLQLIEPSSGSSKQNREQQVAEVSRTIKLLAMELMIPIIALSQRNSDGATRESRAPENDCNALLTIEEDDLGDFSIEIKAARDCGNAKIPVVFHKELVKFSEEVQ